MDDFEKELKTGFLDEAAQLLADTEQCFLNLETSSEDPSVLEKIFRLAHNLKGSAKAVGFLEMGEFTHVLESLILKVKNKEILVETSIVSLLLRCNDHLREMVETLKGNMDAVVDSASLMTEMRERIEGRAGGGAAAAAPAAETPSVHDVMAELEAAAAAAEAAATAEASTEAAPTDAPAADDAAWTTPEQIAAEFNQMLSESPVTPEAAPVAAAPAAPAPAAAPAQSATAAPAAPTGGGGGEAHADESIRVSLSKLEGLMNNVGEMVILQAVLNQHRYQLASPLLQKTIAQLAKISKNIQETAMALRMVPLKSTFQKMHRIVRDTSKALNKDVQLILVGEDTELDKTVLEHVGDPLVHLVRNAVDHGLENTDERAAVGKPMRGTVWLKAFHKGGRLIVEVTEDGRGLNPAKLRDIATKKGLIKPDAVLSDKESYELIFASGFSTKTEVTDISGRGVGMDVVRTNIRRLEGEVEIETQLGKGTTFRISLPLTLAIVDGMLLKEGPERYVIPLSHMHESVRPSEKDVHKVSGLGEVLVLRGESMPLHRLSSLLGLKRTDAPAAKDAIAIVVRVGPAPFAVLIDDIIGQQQVVIKRLGPEVPALRGISGSAILGDGRAALILDLVELTRGGGAGQRTSAPARSQGRMAS